MAGLIMVGAWTGEEFAGVEGPLLLFEPQTRPFAELAQRLGHRDDVVLVNAAAGAKAGEGVMHTVEPDHSSSLIRPEWLTRGFSLTGEERVRITTVDETLAQLDSVYEELRIDTQGYELEVLRGAQRTLTGLRRVECELHDPKTYPAAASLDALDEFMNAHGFERVSLTPRDGDDPAACYERRPAIPTAAKKTGTR